VSSAAEHCVRRRRRSVYGNERILGLTPVAADRGSLRSPRRRNLGIKPHQVDAMVRPRTGVKLSRRSSALDVASGKALTALLPETHPRQVHRVPRLDRQAVPAPRIHVICDNYGTHKPPKVREWLKEHPRFQFHFTPTSASWLTWSSAGSHS
jgi:hypothetical protein